MSNDIYCLAIDVGTSRVAAATASSAPDGSPIAAPFTLGRRADAAPAVAFIADDGTILLGDAAERRGLSEPERLIREFKRSLGDDIPFVVGDRPVSSQELFARSAAAVVDAVTEREGSPSAGIVLTHPVTWGAHRIGLVLDALAEAGIDDVMMISEPEAAARHYEATHDVQPGQVVVVYDLGGGTFDLAALRKAEDGTLELVGTPVGLDDLGGADFDDAVLRHVVRSAELSAEATSADDEAARLALAQLRRECVEAKESLSFDTEATVPVLVPPHRTSIRLTRAEFEEMIAPSLERTADALDDLLTDNDIAIADVAAVLLVGGSSRIPLITQTLSDRFGRPIAVDADPKSSMALGAARWGLSLVAPAAPDAPAGPGAELVPVVAGGALAVPSEASGTELDILAPTGPNAASGAEAGGNRWYAAALVTGAVVIAGGIILGGSMAAGFRLSPDYDVVTYAEGPSADAQDDAADDSGSAKSGPLAIDRSSGGMNVTAPVAPGSPGTALPRQAAPKTGLRILDNPPVLPPAATAPASGTAAKPTTPATTPSTPATKPKDPAPNPTTPAPQPSTPAPVPTTPAPEPTVPAPEPTTPAPEPTVPAPEPTTPAPEPTTPASEPPAPEPPAPEPTASAPAPAPEPPAPAPDPVPDPPAPSPEPTLS